MSVAFGTSSRWQPRDQIKRSQTRPQTAGAMRTTAPAERVDSTADDRVDAVRRKNRSQLSAPRSICVTVHVVAECATSGA
jgi:hypothetical protein